MDRFPASPSFQVYRSDVLLFLSALISLTFRAYRNGIDASSNDGSGEHERDKVARMPTASSAAPYPLDEHMCERLLQPCSTSVFFHNRGKSEGPTVALTRESSDDDNESTAASEAASDINFAIDPVLILIERLPLEEKLSTAVNWLSLVSNCLTYSLRTSQVLYTFLFTNGDFVLFVTSYHNRVQRLAHRTHPRHPRPLDVSPALSQLHTYREHAPSFPDTGALAAPTSRSESIASELDSSANTILPLSRSPLPANAPFRPRHREGVPQRDPQRRSIVAGTADNAVDVNSPLNSKYRAFPLGRPLLRLRYYAGRCVAFAQTQLSWLLFLNALLTTTLFIFHIYHLFFVLGTVFGYLAAVASVYLCGMEVGCIVGRLRARRARRGARRSVSVGSYIEVDDKGDGAAASDAVCDPRRSPLPRRDVADEGDEAAEWDLNSGIHGPRWAFLAEHLSAAACSLLYVWMLLEEGDVLWSSHVDLMRWYVCSCALMTLSLLKCLRVVF